MVASATESNRYSFVNTLSKNACFAHFVFRRSRGKKLRNVFDSQSMPTINEASHGADIKAI